MTEREITIPKRWIFSDCDNWTKKIKIKITLIGLDSYSFDLDDTLCMTVFSQVIIL